MKSNKILYTSAEVRKAIIDIFSTSKGRRVAITAFVGSGSEAYLQPSKGIELICWPKAGGTNPDALRKLMKDGVKVRFANALHMKVYWTKDCGAVITSANLSKNALGAGNLKEFGVHVPSEMIDIDKVIEKINPRSVTKEEMSQLDIRHRAYHKVNKTRWTKNDKVMSFIEWYSLPMRNEEWKIGYWDVDGQCSSAAKRKTRKEYKVSEPHDYLSCSIGRYKKDDWILKFGLKNTTPTNLYWMYVDFVVKTDKSDKEVYEPDYPYHAVQVWPANRYPSRDWPFKIDTRFKNALAKAIKKYGVSSFKNEDPNQISSEFIDLIHKYY